MTAEQFAYWLHGFTELTHGQTPDHAQWKAIREHLDLVFRKVTPSVGEVSVKIDVDTKDAEKAVGDPAKQWGELARKTREATPRPNWWQPPTWAPNPGLTPRAVICSADGRAAGQTSVASIITC